MRSKAIAVTLISLLFMKTVLSQSDEILVLGQTGNLYVQHTVVAKENWYSVGRQYNITPKELAAYNKLSMTQPLSIGQTLLIPLNPVNFSQNGQKAAGESLVPLYYVIQEKEWMYRISVNHNKVPITSLEKWNNISKDQVKAGMHIIVGYLKVKTALSGLATKSGGAPVAGAAKPVDGGVTKTTDGGAVKPADGVTKTADGGTTKPAVGGIKPADKNAAKPDRTLEAVTNPADTKTADAIKPADGTTKPVDGTTKPAGGATKPVDGAAKPADGANKPTVAPVLPSGKSFNGGFFKTDFTDGGKSADGAAGIFKSSSGWQDGKYYALMNNIPVGTIVRVTATTSGKTVYAKVLGQLPDMKESAGLTIRISNAAASELGEGDGRFNVAVKY